MQTRTTSPQPPPSIPTRQLLVIGWVMLGSIITWFTHLNVMYFLVQPVCRLGGTWTFHVTSVFLLTVTVLTGIQAWRLWRANRNADQESELSERQHSVMAFAGYFGMAGAAVVSLAIVTQWAPVFVIGPCS